ncbi:MAG: hypothetical protein ACRDQX_02475 [Pseudonocardiaceae bacterium]
MTMQAHLTGLMWWRTAAVTVVLAVISAAAVILLFSVWFVVLPVWAVLVLASAGTCLALSRARPAALAYGIAILSSMPLAIVFAIAFLALASALRP